MSASPEERFQTWFLLSIAAFLAIPAWAINCKALGLFWGVVATVLLILILAWEAWFLRRLFK